jgi:hypothetical protein
MTDNQDPGQELRDHIVETVRASQDVIIEAVRSWAQAAGPLVAPLPGPVLTLEQLPQPTQWAAEVYAVADELASTQQEFAYRLLDAVAPLVDRSRT